MAFVTAYLAYQERRKARRGTMFTRRSPFRRLAALVRVTGEALSEAQDLRRTLTRKYPFMDV